MVLQSPQLSHCLRLWSVKSIMLACLILLAKIWGSTGLPRRREGVEIDDQPVLVPCFQESVYTVPINSLSSSFSVHADVHYYGNNTSRIRQAGSKNKAGKKELKRPIVCICNDVNAPSLRALRKVALEINVSVSF